MTSSGRQWIEASGGIGLNVEVREGGGDVPFLLVHGLASNARLWDGVAARLHSLGHPVAAVDQRGHGQSDKPDTGYDMGTVAADLVAVIETLGYQRPVVAGQSWGGNVVVELAHRLPELTRGIAAIDGGMIELSRRFPTWEDAAVAMKPPPLTGTPAAAFESRLRRAHRDWPETAIAGFMASFEVRPDGTVAPWLTLERHMQILHSLWEHRPSVLWHEIKVPVLLIPADDGADWVADKRASVDEAQAAASDLRVHWFEADHDVHAQFSDQVAGVLHESVEDGFFS